MTIDDVRRDRTKLEILDRLFMVANYGLLVWCVVITVVLERLDPFYATLYFTMTCAGVARILIWKVRAIPAVVLALRGPNGDEAWSIIEAHRPEILGRTELWAMPNEPDLVDLDRAGVVARLERARPTRWRPIMTWWCSIWALCFIATMIGMALYEPNLQSPKSF